MSIKEALINANAIQVGVDCKDWKEVIAIAAKPLLVSGKITDAYIEGIISSTIEHGAYYVLGEGVAIPHARPECGALDTGFSMVILKTPISIEGSEDVDILVMFSAKDSNSHIQDGIKQIVEMLDDDTKLLSLRNATTVKEVVDLL
ncbi:PTS sugar transporter subunit IIA [Vibrio sp. DW001]|uniref:PTS sugar transporter subunit IIA n=1 Tax=Vibrio sp. DW001 TaxID=2912315 RepID=UPI0023AE9D76|nr:PTS sugar transporter subunit IIA [Vibrio sp. DW001]WED25940.1 PTS sugar transporter subunit IIA [Vibrio sp. DW001]